MHGRYEVPELLKLRQSPLVIKPKGLPPAEEWMGAVETKRQTTPRGKLDEPASQIDGLQKRPTLLDTASRRSTTDGAGIHLGPPRNSFASSNTARSRNGTHERTKTNEDVDSKLDDRRSATFAALNGKFGARPEGDSDTLDRPRRRLDDEAVEARPRRDHDRPKWNSRDNQLDNEKSDDTTLRSIRDPSAREKFSQPWTRKEKPMDQEDGRRDNPAWRRGQRERDFERQDAEPEWVDSVEVPEPAKQHTHEDFLRWKESMTGRPTADTKPNVTEEQQEKIVEVSTYAQTRVISDPIVSGDKFFAKFEENKGTTRPTKSRFANIFGPKDSPKPEMEGPISSLIPVPEPAELEQPSPHAEPERRVDADFAKLLAMLGKNEGPQASVKLRPARSPVNIAELASTRSPDLPTDNATTSQSTQTPVLAHTPQLSLDRLIESRSPAHHEKTPQTKPGAQELLELLQRSNLQDRQEQRQPAYVQQDQRVVPPPPGLANYHDREHVGPPLISTRRETSRSIFDDPAFAGYRNEPQQYRPLPASSFPDHGGYDNLLATMNKMQTNRSTFEQRPTQDQQVPPGLQRPPGLDSRPPPGWSGNQPPPPPPQRQSSQHIPNYNHGPQQSMFPNPNQAAYGQPQRLQQPPIEQQRPPQRKMTGDMPGYVNYPPPGFGPSPTYASPASPDQFAAMRNNYGLPERIGGRERLDRPPPPPPQPNPFVAMYGSANNGRGNAGGVQLPPGFR